MTLLPTTADSNHAQRALHLSIGATWLLCGMALLAGCGGGGGGGGPPPIPLAITPTSVTLDAGMSKTFVAGGGTAPYTFSVVSGTGSIDAMSGAYSTSTTAGSAVVQVADAAGKMAQAKVTVDAALGLSATSTVDGGTTQTIQGTGGQGPYQYAIVSGAGTINSSSGLFTAPLTAGSTVVGVTDANGGTFQVTITNYAPLTISPPSITVTAGAGQTMQFAGQGGSGGYSYVLVSGPGTLSATGLYTAVNTSGTATIQVTDSLGSTANATARVLRIRVNGEVLSAATDGTNWYLGGRFNAVNPYSAPGVLIVDGASGNPTLSCDLGSGFLNGHVASVVASATAIYVGGNFTSYRGSVVGDIVKLDPTTCALDATFSAGGGFNDNGVSALLLSGTALYAAGGFTSYRGTSVPGLVKLDATTGALDTTFSPTTAYGGQAVALTMVGTALYVGGGEQPYLAKMDASTGALDMTFGAAVQLNNYVSALASSSSAVYASGGFTQDGSAAVKFAKLDPTTGALDPTFTLNAGTYPGVDAMALSGSSIYIGSNSPGSGFAQLAKLDATAGTIDGTFTKSSAITSAVMALTVAGSSVYFGGNFSSYVGAPANYIAKVDATSGALDTTFTQSTGLNALVRWIMTMGTTVYAAGDFSTYRGQPAGNVAKFSIATDAVDPTFSQSLGASGPNGSYVAAVALAGSSLFAAGNFSYFNGANSAYFAQVDPVSGAANASFPLADQVLGARPMLGTSSALYVGTITNNCGSTASGCVALIDPTVGTFSPAFAPSATTNGAVWAIALNGTSLYIGGSFTTDNGLPAYNLAKIDANTAAVDQTFTSGSGIGAAQATIAPVEALAFSGSSLYVGGDFSSYQGTAVGSLIKIDATTGALDTTFSNTAGTVGVISALTAYNGSLYFGGQVSAYRGAQIGNLGKVDLTTGLLDTAFSQTTGISGDDGSTIVDTLVPTASKVYVGGYFSVYRGSPAYFFVPLDPTSGALLDP